MNDTLTFRGAPRVWHSTSDLRFVERTVQEPTDDPGVFTVRTVKVLQQRWQSDYPPESKWDDVQLVDEDASPTHQERGER